MIHVIPTPKNVCLRQKEICVPLLVSSAIYPNAADTLCDFARRIYGVDFSEGEGGVAFGYDPDMSRDEYKIDIGNGGVKIIASCEPGGQNGVSTLVQLMEVRGGKIYLPEGQITDCPDCSWRGVMIDLARSWHSVGVIEQYIDMCRYYKLGHIHLHFTDNESYTLPCVSYPRLSTEGRSYTEAEIEYIKAYAKRRGVEIIPEIDLPGHCAPFAEHYGEIFGTYGGVVSQTEESLFAVEEIFLELCRTFEESRYIHIGGDEAAIKQWCKDEATLDAFRARGVDIDSMDESERAQYMYAYFVARMCDVVTRCGKTPVVWEGFSESVNHMIPKNAVVMSWENYYQTTPSLRDAGFRLVNATWAPMYIVPPVFGCPIEDCYNWNIYTWGAVHPGSPYLHEKLELEPTEQVEGAQMQVWGDHIARMYPVVSEGIVVEQTMVEARVTALAENTWNIKKVSDFEEFSDRAEIVSEKYLTLRGKSRA